MTCGLARAVALVTPAARQAAHAGPQERKARQGPKARPQAPFAGGSENGPIPRGKYWKGGGRGGSGTPKCVQQKRPDKIFPMVKFVVCHDGAFGGGLARGHGVGLAAPVGLSPLHMTLCAPERVLVVSTEPPDDLSYLTTPGVGCPRDGLLPVPLTRCIQV